VYEEDRSTAGLLVSASLCENVLDLPPELMLKIFVYLGFIGTESFFLYKPKLSSSPVRSLTNHPHSFLVAIAQI
jgi:hypothetical protein